MVDDITHVRQVLDHITLTEEDVACKSDDQVTTRLVRGRLTKETWVSGDETGRFSFVKEKDDHEEAEDDSTMHGHNKLWASGDRGMRTGGRRNRIIVEQMLWVSRREN